jgi:hypothetical protein
MKDIDGQSIRDDYREGVPKDADYTHLEVRRLGVKNLYRSVAGVSKVGISAILSVNSLPGISRQGDPYGTLKGAKR